MLLEAVAEKELGNAAYKRKDFAVAITHYDKAIELDPKQITLYTNKAASLLEAGDYDKCIEICEKAVEVGRENRVDYELIAKALIRAAHAAEKKGDLPVAIRYYERSLTERRLPGVENNLKKVRAQLKEQERLKNLDPVKAEEEKVKGNEKFADGMFPEALKHYNEAILRNPDDHKLYSNRAACYTKLMEFRLAVKDCDKCVEIDPKFIKGYLRKGTACLALKEYVQAKKAFRSALEIDPECSEAMNGIMSCATPDDPEAVRKQALNDPEVIQILQDPAMRHIFDRMDDPKARQEYLNNPEIASKLGKLIDAGLVTFR